jgi:hypothetical protein
MKINEVAKRAHDHAKKNGFFGDNPGLAIGDKIQEEGEEFAEAFAKGRHCEIGAGALTIIESDLSGDGHFRAPAINAFEAHVKNTIPDELIDGILVNLSGLVALGYPDVEAFLLAKMAYNSVREDHNKEQQK